MKRNSNSKADKPKDKELNIYELDYDPAWDEWYDSSELENKKNKIKRSNKRSSKNKGEW